MRSDTPTATYRIQLRGEVDFARVESLLPYFERLGISHLYLSPIFHAQEGSTHGYDIIDPTRIDPVLGGPDGFAALARAAAARGMGIILDIVPNHTAFSIENGWLWDVLTHGAASRYAPFFDIDWNAGPLILPFLPDPFAKMLTAGDFSLSAGQWRFGNMALPLAPDGPQSGDLQMVHDAQHWRLVHSDLERDGITHRRFFNVTSLIGMRIEDPAVFEATHALIFDLVRTGQVSGLRVDHIDGLADPKTYLDRMAEALPGTPVWVEKILVGDEALPPEWQTLGTTGYETARLIACALTDPVGITVLDASWRQATGIISDFSQDLRQAKLDVLDNELAAERRQLRDMAMAATSGSEVAEPGPESLREAITGLLLAMPRYRSYVARTARPEDRALLASVADQAAQGLRSRAVLDLLVDLMLDPPTDCPDDPARTLVRRFQQVSGALLAKAQEDTAGFRWTRYLPANEVGAEPDQPFLTPDQIAQALSRSRPAGLVLVSGHDTKRSGDSRMRQVAISHFPDAFQALYDEAGKLPSAGAVDPRWRWYVIQSALAITGADDAAPRLQAHLEKAMREAKLTSYWSNPDLGAEAAAQRFAVDVLDQWQANPSPDLARLLHRGEALIFAQLAFQMLMPGCPDIYQGDETGLLALTDPDNRRPACWQAMSADPAPTDKLHWTRTLLDLRGSRRDFLRDAAVEIDVTGGTVLLVRTLGGHRISAAFCPSGTFAGNPAIPALLFCAFPCGSAVRVTLGEGDKASPY